MCDREWKSQVVGWPTLATHSRPPPPHSANTIRTRVWATNRPVTAVDQLLAVTKPAVGVNILTFNHLLKEWLGYLNSAVDQCVALSYRFLLTSRRWRGRSPRVAPNIFFYGLDCFSSKIVNDSHWKNALIREKRLIAVHIQFKSQTLEVQFCWISKNYVREGILSGFNLNKPNI